MYLPRHRAGKSFNAYHWRTVNGAEVDFILDLHGGFIIPIEVKFRNINTVSVSRGFRSFIDAYQPKYGFYITKDFNSKIMINNCEVSFISISRLFLLLESLRKIVSTYKIC